MGLPDKDKGNPARPALKPVSTMEAVRLGGAAPAARAFPEHRSELRAALHRSIAPEKATPEKPAEQARPVLKPVSTMEAVRLGGGDPAARAFPEHRPELKAALYRQVQPEKATPEKPPVEREAAKLQPKLQPSRTPGPGPSMASSGVVHTNRTSTFRRDQVPAKPEAERGAPERKADAYRQDRQAATRQQEADKQRDTNKQAPGRSLSDYRPARDRSDEGRSR